MMNDRAATETLGFVLTFALVTASIGIIYTGGFAGLQDTRNAEQIENVERAFEVLGENVEDVRRYGTPSRSTEIRLLDGSLSLSSPTRWIQVNVSGTEVAFASMSSLTFRDGDNQTEITYEGGAIFRGGDESSVMLSEPGWIVNDDELLLPLVQTQPRGGTTNLDIRGTALVIAHSINHTVQQFDNGTPLTVNITVQSPRADAWSRYFEEKGFTKSIAGDSPDDGVISYQIQVSEVYLSKAIIAFTLNE